MTSHFEINMKIKIKKTHPLAIIPRHESAGAACFDLRAIESGEVEAHGAFTFNTGLSFEVPEGHAMLVYSRSGHGFKNGLRLVNSVGVIDSDYRGTVAVKLQNDSPVSFCIEAGDRIAQAMIVQVPQVTFDEVEKLSETERGQGGFGSTGK